MASKSFIQSLPKAELHLHLEGSVDPATLAELSRRYNTPLPTENNRYDVAAAAMCLRKTTSGVFILIRISTAF